MADLTVKVGDKGYYLNFTVQDSTGTAYTLTGYTITFKVWKADNPGTLWLSGACSIVVAASGTCRYLTTATDFPTAGDYVWELELTQSGVIENTETYTLKVESTG